MVQKEVTVQNKLGLHVKPCQMLVKTANSFRSEIRFLRDDTEINGKSIIGVMSLAATKGTNLTIQADGVDEEFAVEQLVNLFDAKFNED